MIEHVMNGIGYLLFVAGMVWLPLSSVALVGVLLEVR